MYCSANADGQNVSAHQGNNSKLHKCAIRKESAQNPNTKTRILHQIHDSPAETEDERRVNAAVARCLRALQQHDKPLINANARYSKPAINDNFPASSGSKTKHVKLAGNRTLSAESKSN
ncbi:MAG: hypothetical protein V8T51_02420 [Senegalimassilia faecalis]